MSIIEVEQVGEGTIGQRTLACIVEVDAGLHDGLQQEMTLFRSSPWDDARIVFIDERRARVRFVYSEEPTVKTRVIVGCRFSTESPHWYDIW